LRTRWRLEVEVESKNENEVEGRWVNVPRAMQASSPLYAGLREHG
jgi:hypothetical protein